MKKSTIFAIIILAITAIASIGVVFGAANSKAPVVKAEVSTKPLDKALDNLAECTNYTLDIVMNIKIKESTTNTINEKVNLTIKTDESELYIKFLIQDEEIEFFRIVNEGNSFEYYLGYGKEYALISEDQAEPFIDYLQLDILRTQNIKHKEFTPNDESYNGNLDKLSSSLAPFAKNTFEMVVAPTAVINKFKVKEFEIDLFNDTISNVVMKADYILHACDLGSDLETSIEYEYKYSRYNSTNVFKPNVN